MIYKKLLTIHREATKRDITNMIREDQKIATEKGLFLSSDNIIYLIQAV